MKLYHGSNTIITTIDLEKCRFYVEFVKRIIERVHSGTKIY